MLYNFLILFASVFVAEDNTFDYQFENRRVEISFSIIQKGDNQAVIGNIMDRKREEGFPGMHIYFKKEDYGAISDVKGNFEIVIPDNKNVLFFSFIRQRKVALDLTKYQITSNQ